MNLWVHSLADRRGVGLTEKVDSRVMASVLFTDFTVVKQSVTLKKRLWLMLSQLWQALWLPYILFNYVKSFFVNVKVESPVIGNSFPLVPSEGLLVSFHKIYMSPGSGQLLLDCQINIKKGLNISSKTFYCCYSYSHDSNYLTWQCQWSYLHARMRVQSAMMQIRASSLSAWWGSFFKEKPCRTCCSQIFRLWWNCDILFLLIKLTYKVLYQYSWKD